MKYKIIAEKYCQSLVSNLDQSELQETLTQLTQIIQGITTNHNIWLVIQSPLCGEIERQQLISNCLEQYKAHPKLHNLFSLLVTKKRVAILPDLQKAAERALLTANNQENVVIETAHELSEAEKNSLLSIISKQLNTKLTPEYKINDTLLGGFKAQAGEKLLEGSINKVLQQFNEQLCGVG